MKLRVYSKSRAEVEIVDGHDSGFNSKQSTSMRFRPRQFPYNSVLIDARSGYFSIGALRRLAKEQIPIFLTEPDGSILYSILPPSPIKPDVRIAQVQASNDPRRKFEVAKAIVQAKISRNLQVLDWLGERYDIVRETQLARFEASKLRTTTTVPEIRTTEGRVALAYWQGFGKALPESLEFKNRMSSTRQQRSNNANDPTNSFLNFGYGYLEAEIRRAINAVGLEPAVGFLHSTASYQVKESLTFDLMEAFRWIVDVTVLRGIESRIVDWRAVYFAEPDFKCRLDTASKEKFIHLLRARFNERAPYKGQRLTWSSIVAEKCNELARFLVGKSKSLSFMEPSPTLLRFDGKELRSKILSLTASEAKQLGIPKQSLHDLRTKARSEKPFKLYKETRQRLLA